MIFNKLGPQLIRLLTHSPEAPEGTGTADVSVSVRTEATHATPMNSRGRRSVPAAWESARLSNQIKRKQECVRPRLRNMELCTSPKQECGQLITMSSINYSLKYGPWLVRSTLPHPWRGRDCPVGADFTLLAPRGVLICDLRVLGLLSGREAGGPTKGQGTFG